MLAELMRLKRSIAVGGTHGKTTTTAMMAALLDAAELDPTVVNGGIINAYGTNARLGQGEWIVVEADESDGSFLRLPATVAVVTNIDPEHMEHYGSFDAVRDAFHAFVERVPFYGFAALCIDHPEVQALYGRVTDRRLVTYGFSPQADIQALPPQAVADGEVFDVVIRAKNGEGERRLERVQLSLPGLHNVSNALAVIAVARELGIADAVVRRTLSRASKASSAASPAPARSTASASSTTTATIRSRSGPCCARPAPRAAGRVIAVVQPHRYSRLASLFEEFCTCFHDADTVLVAPVYAAGEQPIEGVTATRWSTASGGTAIATCGPSTARTIWPR